MILKSGLQADLRTVIVETWGAGLHYFTGNRDHNIQLRLRANHRNLSVSEHGIFEQVLKGTRNSEANRRIARRMSAGSEEVDVFHAVGLPYIVPELRNGDGEIEAADHGRLPLLVDDHHLSGEPHLRAPTAAVLSAQLQTLTQKTATTTAAATLRWVCWIRPHHDVIDADARGRFRHQARRIGERFGVRVFCGVESAVDADGAVVLNGDVRADVDVVLADCSLVGAVLSREAATKRLLRVVESGRVDGLARLNGRRLLVHDGVDIDAHAVLLACAQQHVFVEVSGEPDRLDLDHRGCRVARDVGAALAITGRASNVVELDRRRFATWQARRGWVTPLSVLNALEIDEVGRRFKRGGTTPLPDDSHDSDDDGASLHAVDRAVAVVNEHDPLQAPLSTDMRERLEKFLIGAVDDDLRHRLERGGHNALQRAFALLAG